MQPVLMFFMNTVKMRLPNWLIILYVVLAIICTFLTFFAFWMSTMNSVFHRNLKRLYQIGVLSWFVLITSKILMIIARLVFFPYGSDSLTPTCLFILTISAFLRYYFVFFFCAIPLSITIERTFATIWLRDYERSKRFWILWLIVLPNMLNATILSYLVISQLFTILMMALYVTSVLSLAFIIFVCLFWYNSRKFHNLEKHHRQTTYTLSIKYQLKENLVTLRSMRKMLIVILIAIFVIFLAYVVPAVYDFPDLWATHTILDGFFNFFPLYTTPAYAYCIPQCRELVAAMIGRSKSVREIVRSNETDIYFILFQKSITFTGAHQS
uniref:Uncharacterized protein n=1 Tax=Caenorhabditis japonica TaxID=281687 RepID=A0A8R1INI3_CAEJA